MGSVSICGRDVFVLGGEEGSLRKLSFFPVQKAVEKLHWRECSAQAALLADAAAPPPPRSAHPLSHPIGS